MSVEISAEISPITEDDILLVVDVQKDFCSGGALVVPDGDAVVAPINQLMHMFKRVVSTRDWHPSNHCSFVENGGEWTSHCIQGTPGAEYHSDLESYLIQVEIRKGMKTDKDEYSGVAVGCINLTEGVINAPGRIFVVGLATDFCIRATALELQKAFAEYGDDESIFVVLDACRGVAPETTAAAIEEMEEEYIQFCNSTDLVAVV